MSPPDLPSRDDRPGEPEPQSPPSLEIPSYIPSWLLDTPAPASPPVGLRREDLTPPEGTPPDAGPLADPEQQVLPWTAGPPSDPAGPAPVFPASSSGWGEPPDTSWLPWDTSSWTTPASSPSTESEGAGWRAASPHAGQASSTPWPSPATAPWESPPRHPLGPPHARRQPGHLHPSGPCRLPFGTDPHGPEEVRSLDAVQAPEQPLPTSLVTRSTAVCRRTSHGCLTGRVRQWAAAIANRWLLQPMHTQHAPYVIREARQQNESTSTLVLVPAGGRGARPSFTPGTFVWLRLDSPTGPLQGPPLTVAPQERDEQSLELSVADADADAVEFTAALLALSAGRLVFVEGPYVDVADEHRGGRSLLLICAGAGITPMMSILRAHAHRRDRRPHVLVVSGHTPDDLLFGDELRHLTKLMNLDIVPIVSVAQPGWTGRVGQIDAGLLATLLAALPILRSAAVSICGPAGMAEQTRRTLMGLGFDDRRIHSQQLDTAG